MYITFQNCVMDILPAWLGSRLHDESLQLLLQASLKPSLEYVM